jgi:hypothetical protein
MLPAQNLANDPTRNVQEKPLSTLSASQSADTITYFFPRPVHLRLQDGHLLKFAPGAREVPNSLHPEELAILARNGAKPIEKVSKQVVTASEELAAAHATGADTSRANAALDNALAASGEDSAELTKEEQDIAAMPEGAEKEAAKADLATKRKAAKDSAAKAEADAAKSKAKK